MQIASRVILVPGTRFRGVLMLAPSSEMPFEAEVTWARRIPPELGTYASSLLNCMAVRYLSAPSEAYCDLLRDMWERRSQQRAPAD